jgi:hypothetical protein
MLIHVVADYGHGDLAFAEVAQRLCLNLAGATLVPTPVHAERVVFHNVAPRADTPDPRPGNQGERLVCARLGNRVLVVGLNAGYTFSSLREEALILHEVPVLENIQRCLWPGAAPGVVQRGDPPGRTPQLLLDPPHR